MKHSRIYTGRMLHHRRLPRSHRFSYRLFMLYLDLDELPDLFTGTLFWSARRPAPAWFRRADHLGDPSQPVRDAVSQIVFERTGLRPEGPIRLLTHLRYFGYCMNPVSFYYCWNRHDTRLDFIVAEVHNTPWGERHCYVLRCASQDETHAFAFDKAFHVSPFMSMQQRCHWRFETPGDRLTVVMDNHEAGHRLFRARMNLLAQPCTARNLDRTLLCFPLMTIKVITAIYWQALRLWLKRTPFHAHPATRTGESLKNEKRHIAA